MSLNIRWLTNGKEKVYTVTDSLRKTFEVYEEIEEIPVEIRYYAENIKAPTFCEPDLARFFGVQSIFILIGLSLVVTLIIKGEYALLKCVNMEVQIKGGRSANILEGEKRNE